MTYPSVDLYPSEVTFPAAVSFSGDVRAVVVLNGLYLTGIDSFGVEWRTVRPIDGWDSSPASSLQLTQKTRAPGAWPGPRFLTPRSIGLTGYAIAPDADTMIDAIDRLNAAATLEASVLTVQRSTDITARSCIVYRQGGVTWTEITDTTFQWQVDLVAADPRKFTTAVDTSTGLPATSGGLTVPFTVPFSIDSTVVSGQAFLTNPGNATGPVVLRIDGPVTGPAVTHVSTGLQLVFSSSLTLAAGEYLLVDMEAQTALANGQASRNGWIESRGWFGLDAGANMFTFAAVSGSGQLTVTGTPAWL